MGSQLGTDLSWGQVQIETLMFVFHRASFNLIYILVCSGYVGQIWNRCMCRWVIMKLYSRRHRTYVSKNEVDLAVVIDGARRFSSTGAVVIWRGREEFDVKPIYTM